MDWAQVLVIILSIFLAIFLLLGIVLTVLLIRVTLQIKSITESAQRTVSGIEGLVASVSKFASPAIIIKTVVEQIKKSKKRSTKKGD